MKTKTKVKIRQKDNVDKGDNKYGERQREEIQGMRSICQGQKETRADIIRDSVFSRRRTSKRTNEAKDKHMTRTR